ncbi:hypothetical protein [Hyalangium versicolor]|uniref:hypothetical protein n=1 Tax=Hyalangium versicolor TaxID=2861190 RepID=UPI001CCB28C6|nr:hypothetical protein [Hyalangium versicolor]
MKRMLFIAILTATASACVEGSKPVQLIGAKPLSPTECGTRADDVLEQYSGSLDYAASTHYFMSFGLFSPLVADDNSSEGTGFIGSEIIFNYESLGVKGTFKEESRPIYLVVDPGASPDESYVVIDLIGSEARTKLDSLVPSAPDTMTLLATFKIKGELASGRSAETNEVTYPIELTRGQGCGENTTARPPVDYPCVNPGQDGYGYQCL